MNDEAENPTASPTLDYRPPQKRAERKFGPLVLSLISLFTALLPALLFFGFGRPLERWAGQNRTRGDILYLAFILIPLLSIFLAGAAIKWGKRKSQRAPENIAVIAIAIGSVTFVLVVLAVAALSSFNLNPN